MHPTSQVEQDLTTGGNGGNNEPIARFFVPSWSELQAIIKERRFWVQKGFYVPCFCTVSFIIDFISALLLFLDGSDEAFTTVVCKHRQLGDCNVDSITSCPLGI